MGKMNKKKDWRKIKEECVQFTKPSHPILTKDMHRMIANYNYAARDNQDSEYAEAREGR
jgi:hypothetical protein